MASSTFVTTQYNSEQFVESCGAILFDLQDTKQPKVCLLYYLCKDEWLLAKGRRNCSEPRPEAALREVVEETGYRCHLHPVTMPTRAPLATEPANVPDGVRSYSGLTEPFMVTVREIEGKSNVKFIWWFMAALDKGGAIDRLPGETGFRAQFLPLAEAVERLTFKNDRDVLTRAISLL